MCDLVDQEPTNYEEVVQKKEWVDSMTEEYQSIMKNDVWDMLLLQLFSPNLLNFGSLLIAEYRFRLFHP